MSARSMANGFRQLPRAPLPPIPLTIATVTVWLAGALYCSGYEALSTGIDNWPGSLVWSAVAVLPWLILFEFSKGRAGRRTLNSPARIALALLATAALSLTLGRLISLADGRSTPAALSAMRRLPPMGVCLLLILWSRTGERRQPTPVEAEQGLADLAPSIDWIEAADNYVEIHAAGRSSIRRMTMRDAQATLAGKGFVRIHRRFLVNSRRIAGMAGRSVRLSCGKELPVGSAFASNLFRAA